MPQSTAGCAGGFYGLVETPPEHPVLAEKLEPGGLRRKLRHLAQLLLVNQNGDGGPGPRSEWGPGPPQIAAPVGGRGAGCPPYGGGLAVRERPSRRSRTIRLPPSARRARRAPRGPKAALS